MAEVNIAPKPAKSDLPKKLRREECIGAFGHRYPVVILQGMARSAFSVAPLYGWLQELEHEVSLQPFPWRGTGDVRRNADFLRWRLEELKALLHAPRLLVICQGESGLILRYCMEKLRWLDFVQLAVFLGTPMRGTWRHVPFPLLPGCRQVLPSSGLIKELRESEGDSRFASRYVSVFSGRDYLFLPSAGSELPGARNIKLGWYCPNRELARSRRVLALLLEVMREDLRERQGSPIGRDALEHLKELDRMVDENPADPQVLLMRGRFFLERGCSEPALKDLNAALRIKKDMPEALLLRAVAYRRRLRYGENPLHNRSLQDLSRAIRLRPGFAEAYFQRGVCHALLGLWEQAREDLDHALILNRDYHAAYLVRALARLRQGEPPPRQSRRAPPDGRAEPLRQERRKKSRPLAAFYPSYA